jgi:isopenicillin N synthase-like dioxygenase
MHDTPSHVPRLPWQEIIAPDGTPFPEGAAAFGVALRDTGFAVITGAPFRSDLLEANYRLMREVFDRGATRLQEECSHPEIGFQRGYMPTRTEFGLRCGGDPDDKEVMAFGSYHNVAVDAVPGYLDAAQQYYAACQDVGYALMHALALYLDPVGSERGYLLGLFRDVDGRRIDDSHMRHIRYPGTAKRMACEHTDSNMLSLLPAATSRGLEVRDTRGRWIPVETTEGDLVVNAGDMLNFISGGRILSTLHRVENRFDDPTRFRHSMPFFYHPDHSQELKILDSCADEPTDRRMFAHERITGYALLYELLSSYKVIPPEVSLGQWQGSMEHLKNHGF